MRDSSKVLINPILSEKASNMKPQNKYVFKVAVDANKIEIKNAVETYHKVKVDKVNVVNAKPKYKRVRSNYGYTRMWKKAIVTLIEGEIDFYKV